MSPLDTTCPFCGAPAGHACVNGRYEDLRDYGYGQIREPHPQRLEQGGWHVAIAEIDRSKATFGVVCSRCNTQRTAPTMEAALDMKCPGCGR